MSNRVSSVDSDEETLTIGATLAKAVAIFILFVASRLIRAFWSEMAGDAFYWILAIYIWVCFARLRLGLFGWVRNPDTSFMLNIIVVAIASFAVITGLRIATAPLIYASDQTHRLRVSS